MISPVLRRMIECLDDAVAAPPEQIERGVIAALGESLAGAGWLTGAQCRSGRGHYTRHVLYGDPDDRFTIAAIAWAPGQQSPIHAHYTWCGVGVYHGELTETCYRNAAARGAPLPVQTCLRNAGALSFDRPLTGIHRIANLGRKTAVSLHIYGIGKKHIATGVNRILE